MLVYQKVFLISIWELVSNSFVLHGEHDYDTPKINIEAEVMMVWFR